MAAIFTLLAVLAISNYASAILPAATSVSRTTHRTGYGYGGLLGGYGLHYPATTAVSHTTHHAPAALGVYGGYGLGAYGFGYPGAATVSHTTHHAPYGYGGLYGGYGLAHGGLYGGYGLHHGGLYGGYGLLHGGLYGGYGLHHGGHLVPLIQMFRVSNQTIVNILWKIHLAFRNQQDA
uniref:Suckerin-7 n=1 Tax=Dosidicus gigas TaxID=346249 RepID=A0A075LWS6_DOSGI|nr:suckerin-7 [Dosidicus gigas]